MTPLMITAVGREATTTTILPHRHSGELLSGGIQFVALLFAARVGRSHLRILSGEGDNSVMMKAMERESLGEVSDDGNRTTSYPP